MKDDWILHGVVCRETDIYLFGYGNDYKKALKTLFYVSGKAAFPRKYVFGSWYSRWWAYTASSSNVGLFYWRHDTGGFFGELNPEMYVRWTQFSVFSACLHAHSGRNAVIDRCPWLWGKAARPSRCRRIRIV